MISLTFYTNNVSTGFAGCSSGPVIRIRPEYKDDVGLLKHEQTHVNQWWMGVLLGVVAAALMVFIPALSHWSQWWPFAVSVGMMLNPLAYTFVWQYRLWAEVQAYREQARHYSDDRRLFFAQMLHTKYSLPSNITEREIYERLKA